MKMAVKTKKFFDLFMPAQCTRKGDRNHEKQPRKNKIVDKVTFCSGHAGTTYWFAAGFVGVDRDVVFFSS